MIENPFPGPLPYRDADRARFFGRDELAHALREAILAHRCISVYGPPGAGKSSLLRASVLPLLIEAHDVRTAYVQGWPEKETPARWLSGVLYRALGLGAPPDDLPPREALTAAAQRVARRSERLMVIALDHMEQNVYEGRRADARDDVLECVRALVELPVRNVRVVLSFREDHLGRILDLLPDRRWILEHGFRVEPLSVAEITDAACRTATLGHPPQTWTAEDVRPLMIQTRVPGQAAKDHTMVQLTFAQVVCRSLFQRRAEGAAVMPGSISGVFQLDSRLLAMMGGTESRRLAPVLRRALERPFMMVLGDLEEDRTAVHQRLTAFLQARGEAQEEGTSLRALVEVALQLFGQEALHTVFAQSLTGAPEGPLPPLVQALGRLVPPGAHVSMTWGPQLARAVAAQQPERSVVAVQPSLLSAGDPPCVVRRAAGASAWEVVPGGPGPTRFDLENDVVVLSLYGGFSTRARPSYSPPQLHQDGPIRDFFGIDNAHTPAWVEHLLERPSARPGLFLGISLLDWRHRQLLRWLYDHRPAAEGSVALLTPAADPGESTLWDCGAGLFGDASIAAHHEDPVQLVALLDAFAPEASP